MELTWICRRDKRRIVEVAVPVVLPHLLEVEVHGDGSMRNEVVRVETRAALALQRAAIHLRAGVVQVRGQSCFVRGRFGHAPSFVLKFSEEINAKSVKEFFG